MKSVQQFIEEMRVSLAPAGTAPIVKLQFRNNGYLEHSLVSAAIDELESKMLLSGLGEDLSALEKLSILLLTESVPKA